MYFLGDKAKDADIIYAKMNELMKITFDDSSVEIYSHKLKSAGLDKVMKEVQTQADTFINTNK